MFKKIKVVLIFGGRSGEHEVSIASAAFVLKAFDKNKYEVRQIYINKKGSWYLGSGEKLITEDTAKKVFLPGDPTLKKLIAMERQDEEPEKFDIAFPILHGTFGEDGSVQGLLELAGIPYVGAGVAASAVGMDKVLMKQIFEGLGLPSAESLVVLRNNLAGNETEVIKRIEKELGYPVFTKPASLGSSVGVTKAKNGKQLGDGLKIAAEYDRKILVEKGLKNAREIDVSVLGNDNPRVSVCGEIIPSKEFFDYEDKYILDRLKVIIPAELPENVSNQIREMASRAYKAIDCSGMARVDFLVEGDNKIYISEVNTIPGFTKTSMFPKLWEATGLSHSELINELISLAIERYNDKSENNTSYPLKLLQM